MKYNKMDRLESLILEEKIDGSNFCYEIQADKFHSRKKEITNTDEKFFMEAVAYIKSLNIEKKEWYKHIFFEVIGMAHIKYGLKNAPIEKRVYLIDIEHNDGSFENREDKEKFALDNNLNIVPLTTHTDKISKIDNKTLREGYIMKGNFYNPEIRIKIVERKFRGGKEIPSCNLEIREIE